MQEPGESYDEENALAPVCTYSTFVNYCPSMMCTALKGTILVVEKKTQVVGGREGQATGSRVIEARLAQARNQNSGSARKGAQASSSYSGPKGRRVDPPNSYSAPGGPGSEADIKFPQRGEGALQ